MEEKEFTTKVLAHLEDIRKLYKEFNPIEFEKGCPYLSMTIIDDTIMFWNSPDKRGGGPKVGLYHSDYFK